MNKDNNKSKYILILGSGRLVEPLIDYLLNDFNNYLYLGSNDYSRCINISNRKNKKLSKIKIYPFELNININENTTTNEINTNNDLLEKLIEKSNLIITFIPALYHKTIALLCIKYSKNMLTSNLLEENLNSLQNTVKEKNLLFVTEIGFQPGIDHLLCTKVNNELKENNYIKNNLNANNNKEEELISFECWSGALPAPEVIDNPLMHKFSYNPKLNMLASMTNSYQIINGKVLRIDNNKFSPIEKYFNNNRFHPSLNLEGIFIDDSREFKQKHKLNNCYTVIQGTLRYKGYIFILQCLKNLGLFSKIEFCELSNIDSNKNNTSEYNSNLWNTNNESYNIIKDWRTYLNRYVLRKANNYEHTNYKKKLNEKKNLSIVNEDYRDKDNINIDIYNKKFNNNFNSILESSCEKINSEYTAKDKLYNLYIKDKPLNITFSKEDIEVRKFYFDLAIHALSLLDKKYFSNEANSFSKQFEHLYSSLVYLNLYNETIYFNNSLNNSYSINHNKNFTKIDENNLYISNNDLCSLSKSAHNYKYMNEVISKNELIESSNSNSNIKYTEYITKNYNNHSVFDAFCSLLERKNSLNTNDPELLFMQTKFTIKNKLTGLTKVVKYDLVHYGTDKELDYSATALLVGLPTGVVAQMMLDGEFKEKGIIIPNSENVVRKVFKELENKKVFIIKRNDILAKF